MTSLRTRTVVLAVALLAGCGAPRLINSVTTSGDQMKLLYSRARSSETGLVQCDIAEGGSLTNCAIVPITFRKGKEAK